jgi:subtilisin family serine protease
MGAMPELPDRKLFDALIDHERLLVVPETPSPEALQQVIRLARELNLDLEREGQLAHEAPRAPARHDLRIQQDLKITFDDCESEPDGSIVFKQEFRFRTGAARGTPPRPHPPISQSPRQIWLNGPHAKENAAELRRALEKAGVKVATSFVYSLPRDRQDPQRYAADPWCAGVKVDERCDVRLLQRLKEHLDIDVESESGPWYPARIKNPGDMHELAKRVRELTQGEARLVLQSIPLVVPLAAIPPTEPLYPEQVSTLNLINAVGMWNSVQEWASTGHTLTPVIVFLLDCGVFTSADVSVDDPLSVMIDFEIAPLVYHPGCTPIGGNRHGTQMAGIIGAAWTGTGIAGLTGIAGPPLIKLVSLRCSSLLHIRKALVYAASQLPADGSVKGVVVTGLDMLKLYFNSIFCPAFALEAAQFDAEVTNATTTKDLLFVVPSGNYDPTASPPKWELPAVPTTLSGLVIAGACNITGNNRWQDLGLRKASRYGTNLSLIAPGVDVYSAFSATTYGRDSGTSFAAAHVAGVAALMRCINGTRNAANIKSLLCSTAADRLPVLECGDGLLNGLGAVNAAR